MSLVTDPCLDPLPEKVAIVMGREADGVSQEMLAAADRSVQSFSSLLEMSSSFSLGFIMICCLACSVRGSLT